MPRDHNANSVRTVATTGILANIANRWAERCAKKELRKDVKELSKDSAGDAQIYLAGDDAMPVTDFIAAEVAICI